MKFYIFDQFGQLMNETSFVVHVSCYCYDISYTYYNNENEICSYTSAITWMVVIREAQNGE